MHLTATNGNPFDPTNLARGADLVGRASELQSIARNLLAGTHVWLDGDPGVGVTSLAMEATARLGDRIHVMAVDLGRPLQPDVLKETPGGPVQDERARLTGGQTLGSAAAGLVQPGAAGDAAGAGELMAGLIKVLDQLGQRSATKDSRLVVIVDGLERALSGSQDGFSAAVDSLGKGGQPVTFVFCSHIGTGTAEAQSKILAGADRIKVGPVDPRAMTDWIDERLARAGVTPQGAGAAIVALAGPRTRDRVDLASRTFELSLKAGIAKAATVELAFKRVVNESAHASEKTWKELTPEERKVLQAIAEGRAGALQSAGNISIGHSQPEATGIKRVLEKLRTRGVVSGETQADLKVDSPALRGWILRAKLGFRRERVPSGGSMALNFDLGVERKRGAARQPVI